MSQPKRYFLVISKTPNGGVRPDVYEHEEGAFVDYEEYAKLDAEKWRWANRECVERLEKLEVINELCLSVVNRFFSTRDKKPDFKPNEEDIRALAVMVNRLPDSILDFTEEQVRENPAWALAVFRSKVKQMHHERVHDLNCIGGQQEQIAYLEEKLEGYEVDSVHSCSKGCRKKGCTRGLIEEVEELKKDKKALEKVIRAQAKALDKKFDRDGNKA
jgi:hypothetical protein